LTGNCPEPKVITYISSENFNKSKSSWGMKMRIDEKLKEKIVTALFYGILVLMLVFWILVIPVS